MNEKCLRAVAGDLREAPSLGVSERGIPDFHQTAFHRPFNVSCENH